MDKAKYENTLDTVLAKAKSKISLNDLTIRIWQLFAVNIATGSGGLTQFTFSITPPKRMLIKSVYASGDNIPTAGAYSTADVTKVYFLNARQQFVNLEPQGITYSAGTSTATNLQFNFVPSQGKMETSIILEGGVTYNLRIDVYEAFVLNDVIEAWMNFEYQYLN